MRSYVCLWSCEVIGGFDEDAFRADLEKTMGWAQGSAYGAAIVNFVYDWFDEHPVLQLPCRHAFQMPQGTTIAHCRCGNRFKLVHDVVKKTWNAELIP